MAVTEAHGGEFDGIGTGRARPSRNHVVTKKAARRELRLATLDQLRLELASLGSAADVGTIRVTGNWSPGEIFDHLAIFWEASMRGFPESFRAPFFVRWPAQLLMKRSAVRGTPPPAGIGLPKAGGWLMPNADVTFEQGLDRLKGCIAATEAGEGFVERSPIFGKLRREEWVALNLGHCSLHLSFVWPE